MVQFNAWLLSNTTDILNLSVGDFDFPLVKLCIGFIVTCYFKESKFYVITGMMCVCVYLCVFVCAHVCGCGITKGGTNK